MLNGQVRWGVLSTAGINNSFIPGLLGARHCALAGLASRSVEKAAQEAARWGCRAYGSYEELLDDGGIDAVYIPLPNHMHADWIVRCLEAGKHVLCEKPLALSVAEVDRVAEVAARTGLLVLEAFMYRHVSRWQRAVALVSEGALGEVRLAKVIFAFAVPSDPDNIRFRPEAGGGIIWDMGCYAANMARGILTEEPTEVFGFPEVRPGQPTETSVSGVMRFPGGRAAPFAVSFDFVNPFAQLEVVGTQGWLMLAGTGFRREPYTKLLMGTGGEVFADGREPHVELFAYQDPYTAEAEHLAEAIRGEHPLQWGLEDARANTAVLEAMHRSVASGQPVSVPTT